MDLKRRQPLGVELVKRDVVTEADIQKALDYQRQHPDMKLGDILYELDVCNPYILIKNIGEILGEKGMLLRGNNVKINLTDYISLDVAKKNQAVPFEIENGKIKCGLKPSIMTTTIFELFGNVEEISNEVIFTERAVAAPCIYFKDISITGSQESDN